MSIQPHLVGIFKSTRMLAFLTIFPPKKKKTPQLLKSCGVRNQDDEQSSKHYSGLLK
jgi:hypothetical protein